MLKLITTLILLFSFANSAKITPSEVYGQVMLIEDEVHYLLEYYDIKHNHTETEKVVEITTKLKPRNVWQKTYEIMIKINILRAQHNLPRIEPINMPPVAHLNPDLVYEQTQRVLTELRIFETRMQITVPKYKLTKYKHKTPLDVFNALNYISLTLDELNKHKVTPSYVFGENMRVYDDIALILNSLNIKDNVTPFSKNKESTPNDTANTALRILEKVKQLQILAGIEYIDFIQFRKAKQTPSDVFSLTQMIIAELQTIKAYLSIKNITPASNRYKAKTPTEVDQLMEWNLRKLNLINKLNRM